MAILLGLLALFAGFRRRWLIVGACVLQYVLLHAQLLLGLNSRDDAGLLAFHIPVGVLIFFLAYLTVALGFGVRVASEQA